MIVGDSLNVIKLLQGLITHGWEIKSMVKEARGVLETMECISIHNYKEANLVVDRFMSDAMALKDHKVWDSEFPEHLMALVVVDENNGVTIEF